MHLDRCQLRRGEWAIRSCNLPIALIAPTFIACFTRGLLRPCVSDLTNASDVTGVLAISFDLIFIFSFLFIFMFSRELVKVYTNYGGYGALECGITLFLLV